MFPFCPPPPRRGAKKNFALLANFVSPIFISVYALKSNASTNIYVSLLIKYSVKDKLHTLDIAKSLKTI